MKSEFQFSPALDVYTRICALVPRIPDFGHVDLKQIICYRSEGSSSRATARIWSLPRIWQEALRVSPHYVIEVIAKRFDHLTHDDQDRVLIHELMHIPKTFSGALVPHRCFQKRINHKTVEKIFKTYQNRT